MKTRWRLSEDEAWMLKHFPTLVARTAADAAIDALPVSVSMATYLDTWLKVYYASGGLGSIGASAPDTKPPSR